MTHFFKSNNQIYREVEKHLDLPLQRVQGGAGAEPVPEHHRPQAGTRRTLLNKRDKRKKERIQKRRRKNRRIFT